LLPARGERLVEQQFSMAREQVKGHKDHRNLIAHLRGDAFAAKALGERGEGHGARSPGGGGRLPGEDFTVEDDRLRHGGEGLDELRKADADVFAVA